MAGDNLEYEILTSHAGMGFPKDLILPLNSFTEDTGLALTAATTPRGAVLATTAVPVIQWAANAAVTVQAAVSFIMPFDYNYNPDYPGRAEATANTAAINSDFLKFYGIFRRQRAAADAATGTPATEFRPRATVVWWTPGSETALQSLTTNPAGVQASTTTGLSLGSTYALLPAITADNTDDLVGFCPMVMDIGERLRAEGKRILPGDQVQILVGPEAVNANAIMQMTSAWVRYKANACFNDVRMRGINI